MYYCKYWANLSSPSTMHGQFEFKLTPRQRQHKQPVADLSFGALTDALEKRMQSFATQGESPPLVLPPLLTTEDFHCLRRRPTAIWTFFFGACHDICRAAITHTKMATRHKCMPVNLIHAHYALPPPHSFARHAGGGDGERGGKMGGICSGGFGERGGETGGICSGAGASGAF